MRVVRQRPDVPSVNQASEAVGNLQAALYQAAIAACDTRDPYKVVRIVGMQRSVENLMLRLEKEFAPQED